MRRGRNIQTKQAFAVVVDGETEQWYLQMLNRNEPNIPFSISPKIPHKKSVQQQYDMIVKLADSEYDKVFWIIDLDVLLKEARENKGGTSSLQEFITYRDKLLKNNKVAVIVNNPCLEYWFLLHFEKTTKVFTACADAEKQVRKHLKGYEKTEKFFKNSNNDIYKQLKPALKTAVQNASLLGAFDPYNNSKAMCEMPLLFKELNL